MQFEFEKSGIESVECLSAKALETEEQKKKAYEEVVKVNSQTTVKKVGLVESLTGETVSDELSLDDGKLNKCFSEEKNFPYDLAETVNRKQKLKKSEYTFVRDAYTETDVWFNECLGAMEKFLTLEPAEREKLFPVYTRLSAQKQDMEVSRDFVLYNLIEILLANIQLDITPSPYFFTSGDGVLGRHRLVEKAIDALEDGGFNPEVFQCRLSITKLLQWRRRGIREFYAWWKHKWTDPDVRKKIHDDLCAEIAEQWRGLSLGLTKRQQMRLKCFAELIDDDHDPMTRYEIIKITR